MAKWKFWCRTRYIIWVIRLRRRNLQAPTPVLPPVSESSEIAPIQVEESETSGTIHAPSEAVTPSDTDPASTKEPELSDTTPISSETTESSQPTHDQTHLASYTFRHRSGFN